VNGMESGSVGNPASGSAFSGLPVRRTILVMRHAKSSWADPGMQDFDRPLNKRGRHAAPRMGRKLLEEELHVDVILASTARRVQQTLELLVAAWGSRAPVLASRELYLASRETLLRQLRSLDHDWRRVLLIAHNPGLEELLGSFTGREEHFPTAAIAWLESDGVGASWQEDLAARSWQMRAFWKPRDLMSANEQADADQDD
jgi:phosphohistidine phosphatase